MFALIAHIRSLDNKMSKISTADILIILGVAVLVSLLIILGYRSAFAESMTTGPGNGDTPNGIQNKPLHPHHSSHDDDTKTTTDQQQKNDKTTPTTTKDDDKPKKLTRWEQFETDKEACLGDDDKTSEERAACHHDLVCKYPDRLHYYLVQRHFKCGHDDEDGNKPLQQHPQNTKNEIPQVENASKTIKPYVENIIDQYIALIKSQIL